ncbi:MAG: hypothetical protein EA412_04545 [Chitinophagaceae bacterium]|nr:MAG: hypothetical protein EA412_04545 [Chitinophagaceae bacterium]
MKKTSVIFCLSKHPDLGIWPEAFWINYLDEHEMSFKYEKAMPDEVENEAEYIKEGVKICELLNPVSLHKKFAPKVKMHPIEWVVKIKAEKSATSELLEDYFGNNLHRLLTILKDKKIGYRHKMDQHPGLQLKSISNQELDIVFHFERLPANTRYYIQITNNEEVKLHENVTLLNNSPCYVLHNETIYPVKKPLKGKKLIPFFRKPYIQIGIENEEKYYTTYIANTLKVFPCKLINIPLEKEYPKPEFKLVLTEDIRNGNPLLKLDIFYNKLKINHSHKSDFNVEVNENVVKNGFTFTYRDKPIEQKAIDLLVSTGLQQTIDDFHFSIENEKLLDKYLEFLQDHKTLLHENEIGIDANWNGMIYQTGKPQIKSKIEHKKEDWFDVQISIQIGKFDIPFYMLKRHIKDNNRQYILPDSTVFLIPEEWMAAFKDLDRFGKKNEDEFLIKNIHLQWFNQNSKIGNFLTFDKEKTKQIFNAEIEKTELPLNWQTKLRPYQLKGYEWLCHLHKHEHGGILADDMGLGKTIQMLAFIKKTKQELTENNEKKTIAVENESNVQLSLFDTPIQQKKHFTALVILPTSLLFNWVDEIEKFCPDINYSIYNSSKKTQNSSNWKKFNLILTSYGLFRNNIDLFREYPFDMVIADESHYFKNPNAKIFMSLSLLKAKRRYAITGTPVENGLSDLWSQLSFVNPGILGSFKSFKESFIYPIEKLNCQSTKEKLQTIIRPFILRRKKQEVAKDLPELTEKVIFCEMSETQNELYEEEKSRYRNMLLSNISGDDSKAGNFNFHVLEGLNKLRLIANHPQMTFSEYEGDSGKFNAVIDTLDTLTQEGHKVLIFSQFVKHLELFKAVANERNYEFSWLTGATKDRQKQVEQFQKEENRKLFFISLKAGGVGLNLTAADYVLMLDPWWNPAAEEQALNRAHRIGRKNKVMVFRFITKDSIEEKIRKMQINKKLLSADFSGSSNPIKQLDKETISELFN